MKYILVLFIFISALACKKDKATNPPICGDGTIEWTGNPNVDGLGWTFRQDSSVYVLKNLPSAFQQSGRNVSICMRKTNDRVPCFCTNEVYYYSVESIR